MFTIGCGRTASTRTSRGGGAEGGAGLLQSAGSSDTRAAAPRRQVCEAGPRPRAARDHHRGRLRTGRSRKCSWLRLVGPAAPGSASGRRRPWPPDTCGGNCLGGLGPRVARAREPRDPSHQGRPRPRTRTAGTQGVPCRVRRRHERPHTAGRTPPDPNRSAPLRAGPGDRSIPPATDRRTNRRRAPGWRRRPARDHSCCTRGSTPPPSRRSGSWERHPCGAARACPRSASPRGRSSPRRSGGAGLAEKATAELLQHPIGLHHDSPPVVRGVRVVGGTRPIVGKGDGRLDLDRHGPDPHVGPERVLGFTSRTSSRCVHRAAMCPPISIPWPSRTGPPSRSAPCWRPGRPPSPSPGST